MNKALIISELVIISIIFSIALSSADIPRIEPYVNDFAHVMSSDDITNLNLQADAIEKNTSWEIAIVTVDNTEGLDAVTYANKIGDLNGVGKKGQDNGVVVLWSVSDSKGAIATGRYSESILNDAKVVRIGKASRPYFVNGSYYQGFSYILTQINNEITSNQVNNNSTAITAQPIDNGHTLLLFIIIVVFLWIVFKAAGMGNVFTGIAIGSILGGRSRGGGGGGGSFGGGSFGGGGGGF